MIEPQNYFTATDRQRGQRNTILGQCVGLIANEALYQGGIVVLLTLHLTQDPLWAIIAYNSFFMTAPANLITAIVARPSSPKNFMLLNWRIAGVILIITGVLVLVDQYSELPVVLILGFYCFKFISGVGTTYWFPVLQDFIPQNQRGRFFARLRASWTLVSLLAVIGFSRFIRQNATATQFAQIIISLGLLFLLRNYFIRKLPELPYQIREPGGKVTWKELQRALLLNRHFRFFLLYLGVFSFTIGSLGPILILYMKQLLQLQDGQNITIAIIGASGAFIAYLFCGFFVDRIGSKRVFFISQCIIAFILMILALFSPTNRSIIYLIIISNILIKGLQAAHGVAATSYLFHLMTGPSRPLFSALNNVVVAIMLGLSTALSGLVIRHWASFNLTVGDVNLSIFQLIIFISGSLALMTLPLTEFIQRGDYQLRIKNRSEIDFEMKD